jgi:hypothetical protein
MDRVPGSGRPENRKSPFDGGVPGVSKPVEIEFKGHRTIVAVARDPDGNQIEMLQIGGAL